MGKRLALIGVGKWGANFLRTIVESCQDELALVVTSKSKEQLDAIAKSNTKIISNISLIDNYVNDIDGAIVATPPKGRAAIVEKLLRHGVPVLAEKPLSLNADTSVNLIQLAKSLRIPLIEDYIHLYSRPYLMLTGQLVDNWPISINSIS